MDDKVKKLSNRQFEVYELLIQGLNTKQIAEKLFVSETTAKTHKYAIYKKLGAHSINEVFNRYMETLKAKAQFFDDFCNTQKEVKLKDESVAVLKEKLSKAEGFITWLLTQQYYVLPKNLKKRAMEVVDRKRG